MKKGQMVDSHDDAKLQLLADSVASACSDYGVLADVDEIRLKEIQKHLKDDKDRMLAVPLFEHDIHHLEALAIFGDSMFRTD
jgi:hypothetical protein